jgi:hypothetical protein
MRTRKAPHVTIENVTFVRFAPTYEGPVETAEQVELRLLALSHAAATKRLRIELELTLRVIAWAQEARAGSAYEKVCAALRDQIAGTADSSQAPLRASETSLA